MRVIRTARFIVGAILFLSSSAGLLGYPSDAPTWYRCLRYGEKACPESLATLSQMNVDPTKLWNVGLLLLGLALLVPNSWWRLAARGRPEPVVDHPRPEPDARRLKLVVWDCCKGYVGILNQSNH